jgi:hypothetical protein
MLAADAGVSYVSRRSLGMGRGSSEAMLDGDRTVVLKTIGKIAYTPRGSGAQVYAPLAKRGGPRSIGPVRSIGRQAVARTTGTAVQATTRGRSR